MKINEVTFIGSFVSENSCPVTKLPEYAFIGRSNVGKSSLINMLCARKKLAKVSNTPGKTQLINYFKVDDNWHLVDLPGYGFAKVSKTKRHTWEKMIQRYLKQRPNLVCTFVLIDIRHPLQEIDLEFINWLGEIRIPFVIVFTKADKLKPHQIEEHVQLITNKLLMFWNEIPQHFVSSASKGLGRDEILNFIEELNNSIEI